MECYCDYDGPTVYRQTARVARWLWLDVDTEFDAGITHWRYAEPTPEPPKG